MSNLTVIQNEIEAYKPEFETFLTNRAISFAKEAEFAMQILQSNKYMASVAQENPPSLRNAIMNLATIGITLNPAQKMAYLVPRKQGKDKPPAICLDISYMGLVQLALQSNVLRLVKADVICKGEQFIMRGADKEPIHEFDPFAERSDDLVTGAYCVAKTVNGDFLTEVMSRHEIDKIRDSSEAWKNENGRPYCPWVRFYKEMCKKTVIKRASKLWPKGEKASCFDTAINYLNENGEGLSTDQQVGIDVAPIKAHIETLENINALNAYWKSIHKLLPAKSHERQELIEAFKARKDVIQPVVDVEPNPEVKND